MIANDINFSSKIKNQDWLSIEKKYYIVWKNRTASQINTD